MSQASPNFFGNLTQQYRGNPYVNSYGQQNSGQSFSGQQQAHLSQAHFTGPSNSTGQSFAPMPQAYFAEMHGQFETATGSTVFGQQGTGFSDSSYGQFGVREAASPIFPPAALMANQTSFPPTYASANQPWFFDSGATNHITNNLQNITQPQISRQSEGILVGNGSALPVTHSGSGVLPTS